MTIRFTIFIHLPYYRLQRTGNKTFHSPHQVCWSTGWIQSFIRFNRMLRRGGTWGTLLLFRLSAGVLKNLLLASSPSKNSEETLPYKSNILNTRTIRQKRNNNYIFKLILTSSSRCQRGKSTRRLVVFLAAADGRKLASEDESYYSRRKKKKKKRRDGKYGEAAFRKAWPRECVAHYRRVSASSWMSALLHPEIITN